MMTFVYICACKNKVYNSTSQGSIEISSHQVYKFTLQYMYTGAPTQSNYVTQGLPSKGDS